MLDDDTQRRYPGVASNLVPATRVAMVEAMQRLNADMVKAKAQTMTAMASLMRTARCARPPQRCATAETTTATV